MENTIRVIRKTDPEYPERLRRYERMPDRLYILGELPSPEKKSIAIIGARSCSAYGRSEAMRFSRAMARHGVQVVSGMAKGVDSWSHIGALEEEGRTFAVLGSGPDVCYPPSHRTLYRHILETGGGILSEFAPGTPALPHHFPLRNRTISALSDIILVIEAKTRSGSLITVSYALEQGKSIYAVPGKNGDVLSEGCNRLIAEGAGIARSPDVILQELGVSREIPETSGDRSPALPESMKKDPQLLKLYGSLSSDEKSLDVLFAETGIPLPDLTGKLIRLCLDGLAEELPGRRYIRRQP